MPKWPTVEWLFSCVRDRLGALRLALAKGDVLAGNFVERDHDVIGRYASGRSDARVDIFQKGKARLLRPPLDETDIENDQIVGILATGMA